MKLLLYSIGFLCCYEATAQQRSLFFYPDDPKRDTSHISIETAQIDPETFPPGCGCLPRSTFKFDKEGHPLLPDSHPDAKYFNDPKYWYWLNVSDDPRLGGYWEIKPEYMDSMPDGEGGWTKTAFWIIAGWKREELKEEERKKSQPQEEHLKFDWPIFIPKNNN